MKKLILFLIFCSIGLAADIHLSWTDNSNNETGFVIERSPGTGTRSYAEITRVASNVVVYDDTGLSPNTAYVYRVRAFNANGYSAYSNEAAATTSGIIPAPPTNLRADPVPLTILPPLPVTPAGGIITSQEPKK